MLKNPARLNASYLVNPSRILFSRANGEKFSSRENAHAQTSNQESITSGRVTKVPYRTVFSRFRPGGRLCEFQIPIARQGGRETSTPRAYVTYPFQSLSSCSGLVQAFMLTFLVCF